MVAGGVEDLGSAQTLAKMILEAVVATKEGSSVQLVQASFVTKLQKYRKNFMRFGRHADRSSHSLAFSETAPDGLCGYRSLFQAWLKHLGQPGKDPRLWIAEEREAFLEWLEARFTIALGDWAVRYKVSEGRVNSLMKMLEDKKAQVFAFIKRSKVGKEPTPAPFMPSASNGWFDEGMCVAFRAQESRAVEATAADYFPLLRLQGDIDSGGYLWATPSNWGWLVEAISEHNYIHYGYDHFRLVEGDGRDPASAEEALKNLASIILGVVSREFIGCLPEFEAFGRELVRDSSSKSVDEVFVVEVVEVAKAAIGSGTHNTRSSSQKQAASGSCRTPRGYASPLTTATTSSAAVCYVDNVNSSLVNSVGSIGNRNSIILAEDANL